MEELGQSTCIVFAVQIPGGVKGPEDYPPIIEEKRKKQPNSFSEVNYGK